MLTRPSRRGPAVRPQQAARIDAEPVQRPPGVTVQSSPSRGTPRQAARPRRLDLERRLVGLELEARGGLGRRDDVSAIARPPARDQHGRPPADTCRPRGRQGHVVRATGTRTHSTHATSEPTHPDHHQHPQQDHAPSAPTQPQALCQDPMPDDVHAAARPLAWSVARARADPTECGPDTRAAMMI